MTENQNQNSEIKNLLFEKLRQRRHSQFSLRMTPMIDMIFLLLVFFLVTARFRPQEDVLPVLLPSIESASKSVVLIEPLYVSLATDSEGLNISIAGQEVFLIPEEKLEQGLADFAEKLNEVFMEQSRTTADPVELVCDEELSWDHLTKVYNLLYGLGISDITFPME